jgi:AcrR family transcriptional regulator
MPAAAKTTSNEIIAAARKLIEKNGLDALSMQAVAEAVGVRAPSLYKRYADRAALVRAVSSDVVVQMRRLLEKAASTGNPAQDLRAIARAHRAYARRSPHLYALVFATHGGAAELPPEEYGSMMIVLFERMGRFGPPAHTLEGARVLVSFTHGFVQMEAAGAFRMGGDLTAAFDFGLEKILSALRR